MEITVKFNSLEEVNEFISGVFIAPGMAQAAREEVAADAKTPSPKNAATEHKTEKKAEPAPEKAAVEQEANVQESEKDAGKAKKATSQAHSETELKLLLSIAIKQGKKAEVKALFEKYGVSCLTDLLEKESDNIDAIYAEAEVI